MNQEMAQVDPLVLEQVAGTRPGERRAEQKRVNTEVSSSHHGSCGQRAPGAQRLLRFVAEARSEPRCSGFHSNVNVFEDVSWGDAAGSIGRFHQVVADTASMFPTKDILEGQGLG